VVWALALCIASISFAFGRHALAAGIAAISSGLSIGALCSRSFERTIWQIFAVLGDWLGRAAAFLLLAPIYFVLLPCIRWFQRLGASDPFCRRSETHQTLWKESDADDRKVRLLDAAFASVRVPRSRPYAVAAVSLVLLFAASEITLRIFGFGHPVVYVLDPQAGYYPLPGQTVTRERGASLRFNSFGMRAPDFPREKLPGVFRILMLGDSTLYGGSYIDQKDLYARRLEAALRETGHPKLEVLNMGVNGWGPFHELGYVRRFGTFGADLAIICVPVGDVYRPLYGLEALPFFSNHAKPMFAAEEVFRHLTWRYTESRLGTYSTQGLKYQREQGIRAYVDLVRELQENHAEVIVEILPQLKSGFFGAHSADEDGIVEELRTGLKPYGVPVHFPVALFRGQGRQEQLYHDKVHLDALGHTIYARYLTQQVETASSRLQAWMHSPVLVGSL